MKDYSVWATWLRMDKDKPTIYIHNKVDDKELQSLFEGLTPRETLQVFDDDKAHIIRVGSKTVIYKTGDCVFCIPATVRAVVNNDNAIMEMYFDYPCEMRKEDLVRF